MLRRGGDSSFSAELFVLISQSANFAELFLRHKLSFRK